MEKFNFPLLPLKQWNKTNFSQPFKQLYHITDMKHNNIGIPFIAKYISTINILDKKINIKDKYTRMQNTALTFFQRMNKQPSLQNFITSIMKKENIVNHSHVTFMNFQLNKFTNTTKIKTDNMNICQTLNSDQFTNFLE